MDYLNAPAQTKHIPQHLLLMHYALLCHFKRVNYVTAAIKKSLITCPVIPSHCEDYCLIIKDNLLQIQWILQKLVPDKLIVWISCSCCKSLSVWVTNLYAGHTDFHAWTSATVTPVKAKKRVTI